jgi:hypothetical protein
MLHTFIIVVMLFSNPIAKISIFIDAGKLSSKKI